MPTYDYSQRQAAADSYLGLRVDRAAAVLAAGTNTLFTVTGRILLTGLLGEIVTTCSGTGSTIQIRHLVTGVTTPTATVLSIASGSIASMAPGRMFTLPAAVGSALTISVGSSAALFNAVRYYLPTGLLQEVTGTGANTGTIKWSLWYVPVDNGAYVEAA
jgi:hypothetical protein